MKNFLKKALCSVITLLALVGGSFFFFKKTPGEPFLSHEPLEPEVLQSIQKHYHTGEPWYKQSFYYLQNLIKNKSAYSLMQQESTVISLLIQGAQVSFFLGLQAFLLAIFFGIHIALYSLLHPKNLLVKALAAILLVVFSFPSYIFAFLMRYTVNLSLSTPPPLFLLQEVCPIIALAIHPTAFIARLIHTNLKEILHTEYLLTAQAKGLPSKTILYRHALRNACLPTLGYITPLFVHIVTGSFAVEKIFGIKGLGFLCGQAILNRDYPLVIGFTLFYGVLVILTNSVVNFFSYFLNPHVRPE